MCAVYLLTLAALVHRASSWNLLPAGTCFRLELTPLYIRSSKLACLAGAYVLSGYSHLLSGDGHVVDGDIYALGTCPVFLMPVLGVIAIILLHIQTSNIMHMTPNIMHTRCSSTYHSFAPGFPHLISVMSVQS